MKITILLASIFLMLTSCSSDSAEVSIDSADQTAENVETTELNEAEADSSEIKCPECGFSELIELPTEYCLIAHDCSSCGYTMHPEGEDCCVFCSHGTHKCPTMQ